MNRHFGKVAAGTSMLLLAACGGTSTNTESSDPITVVDAAEQEITFEDPPKVGCAWAGCVGIMADLGVTPHADGYWEIGEPTNPFEYPDGLPEHLLEDASNPEEWAKAEVDVIVRRGPADPEHKALEQAAPVLYLHHPTYADSSASGLDAYIENLEIMGDMLGKPEAATEAVQRFDETVRALQEAAPEGAADTRFAPIFGNFTDGYRVSGTENPFCVALSTYDFGTCVDAETGEMNAEAFLDLEPDWIGVIVFDDEEDYTDRDDPVWDRLEAVKNDHVYAASSRIYCCTLRGLTHALQEYAYQVWGEEGGIPSPGPLEEFNPATDAIR